MDYRKLLIACGFTLVSVASLHAEIPIKSVDQSGNVTYSDKPTADAVSSTEVQIDAGPSESQVKEAENRSKQTMNAADKAQAERNALTAERKKSAENKADRSPETVVIGNESGYPVYNPPLGPGPPIAIPPGTGDGAQHPIYTPPVARPPIARPMPSPR